eukprot:1557629-Prymnesium_polylepis.1
MEALGRGAQPAARLAKWCGRHGLALRQLKQLRATLRSLQRQLAAHLHIDEGSLSLPAAPFPPRGPQARRHRGAPPRKSEP